MLQSEVNLTFDLLCESGFIPKHISVSDRYGNTADKYDANGQNYSCSVKIPTIDHMLFVKYRYCIGNEAYQKVVLSDTNLPSLYSLQKRAEELNAQFDVRINGEQQFVWEPLERKLIRAMQNMSAMFPQMTLTDGDTVVVKITGNGTSFGSRKSVTNIGFVLIF